MNKRFGLLMCLFVSSTENMRVKMEEKGVLDTGMSEGVSVSVEFGRH